MSELRECSKEENFSGYEEDFWQNLTEGELVDIDLHTACAISEFEYVQTFIENAKELDIVNNTNIGGWTPLMYVCYVGNDEITELLIRKGADVLFEENKHGCTPLMLAASSGNIQLVQRLIENNARINRVDVHGRTALFHAAEHGQTFVVKHLLGVNADVMIRQKNTGYTPYMEAAKQGHEGVFNAFMEHGVDLDVVCNKGYTCRDLAAQREAHVIVNIIDNHWLKSPSLRRDADLTEKVHDWLRDQNPEPFFDDILSTRLQSNAIAIDTGFRTFPTAPSFGTSLGDSTIVDSDRTPVGTPIDSIFQQYMTRDLAQRRKCHDLPSLETFLQDLGLEKYVQLFEDQSVDFKLLLSFTEDDFKELDLKFGPRRKLRNAIERWKQETEWDDATTKLTEVNNLKAQLAEMYSKLQHVSTDLVREKDARAVLEAEQMEGRARRNHIYFIAERVLRACKDLQSTNKTLKKHVEALKTVANENKKDEIISRLKELQKQMSNDTLNTDNITETIVRRVEKMFCDDVTEHSSGSDSPESSCTSFSRSESSVGILE